MGNLHVQSGINILGEISSSLYQEYNATLTQTGTSAPTSNVNGNDNIRGTWSYVDTGSYYYSSSGAFPSSSKVEINIENIQVLSYTMTNEAFNTISAAVVDSDKIEVRTAQWTTSVVTASKLAVIPANGGLAVSDAMSDDILSDTRINIKVWS